MSRPRVFVGSSTEALHIATETLGLLRESGQLEVNLWKDEFPPGPTAIETLVKAISKYDFGMFIISKDDELRRGDQLVMAPRDNVVLELGMFIGARGRRRTFVLAPIDLAALKLPSDLAGVTLATYDDHGFVKNGFVNSQAIVGALRVHVTRARHEMVKLGPYQGAKTAVGCGHHLEVFEVLSGEIRHRWWPRDEGDRESGWSAWFTWDGDETPSPDPIVDIVAVSPGEDELLVVALDSAGLAFSRRWNLPRRWHDWEAFGGGVEPPLAATSLYPGHTEVYATRDGELYSRWRSSQQEEFPDWAPLWISPT
jgi:hypothetical protein